MARNLQYNPYIYIYTSLSFHKHLEKVIPGGFNNEVKDKKKKS